MALLLFVAGCNAGSAISGSSGGGTADPDRPTESLSVTVSTPVAAGPYFGVVACQGAVTDPCDGTSTESVGHVAVTVDIGESGSPLVGNAEVIVGDTITPVGQPDSVEVISVTATEDGFTAVAVADLTVVQSVAGLEALANLSFSVSDDDVIGETFSADCLEGLQMTATETYQSTLKDRIGYTGSVGYRDDFGLVAVLNCTGILVPTGAPGD